MSSTKCTHARYQYSQFEASTTPALGTCSPISTTYNVLIGYAIAVMDLRPHARLNGIIEWTCPVCNSFNRHQFSHGKWCAKCRSCQRSHAFGLRILTLPPGNKIAPIDVHIPEYMRLTIETGAAFAFAERGEWRTREPVHVHDDAKLADET